MAPNSTRLALLKLSMAAILALWVCVWILKPTQFWKRHWHGAEDWAGTTILGDTGLDVVVFCLPVLAVATLGYIYLHLYTQEGRMRRRNPLETILSNPIFVDTPIGILSSSELLVGAIFIMFLAWTYYSNVASDFKKLLPSKSLRLNRWQLQVMSVGVRFGSLTEVCLALLLLPVLRGMSLFRIFGLQFETSVRYHVWIGNGVFLFSILHGALVMFVWGAKNSLWKEITKWQRIGRVNLAGGIALAIGLIIWITSLPRIRRNHFQLFYSAHHLYTAFILLFLLHAGDRHFYLVCSGVLLFALDKVLRIIQSRHATHVISARVLQCKAVELTLPKHPSINYRPTSIIFLNIPSISRFQWHPFSITSSSNVDDDRFSLLIKCHGQWTDSLYDLVYSMLGSGSNQIKSLPVHMEGPYGPANFPYNWYESLILIAGGSGITPFLSIIQSIHSRNGNMNLRPPKIELVYMVKRSEDLSMLAPISSLLLNNTAEPRGLKLKIFVTQGGDRSTTREILQEMSHLKTVIFDPSSSVGSLPIHGGLLGIAGITGLSSLLFLASVSCLSHVFVHHGTKSSASKNPSWVSDLVIICSLLVTTSCAAVIAVSLRWRKSVEEVSRFSRKPAKYAEMRSLEVDDAEYEINFGKRPDLIEILSEMARKTEESRVGVFVCGPDSMERSVASFCTANSQEVKGNEKRQKCVFCFHSINFSL